MQEAQQAKEAWKEEVASILFEGSQLL
jgi:hypothetical protein